jgi:transposase-like protein
MTPMTLITFTVGPRSSRRDTGPLEERQPGRDCRSGKGHFPTEDAARKLLYLAVQNAVPQWTRTRGWTKALLAFEIQFGDRLRD